MSHTISISCLIHSSKDKLELASIYEPYRLVGILSQLHIRFLAFDAAPTCPFALGEHHYGGWHLGIQIQVNLLYSCPYIRTTVGSLVLQQSKCGFSTHSARKPVVKTLSCSRSDHMGHQIANRLVDFQRSLLLLTQEVPVLLQISAPANPSHESPRVVVIQTLSAHIHYNRVARNGVRKATTLIRKRLLRPHLSHPRKLGRLKPSREVLVLDLQSLPQTQPITTLCSAHHVSKNFPCLLVDQVELFVDCQDKPHDVTAVENCLLDSMNVSPAVRNRIWRTPFDVTE